MFIDSALLQLPPPAPDEPVGLPELSSQLTENSEFSAYLSLLEEALPAATPAGLAPLLAILTRAPEGHPLAYAGQGLPGTGEPLPATLPPALARTALAVAVPGPGPVPVPDEGAAPHPLLALLQVPGDARGAPAANGAPPDLPLLATNGATPASDRLATVFAEAGALADGDPRLLQLVQRRLSAAAVAAGRQSLEPQGDLALENAAEGETRLELPPRTVVAADAARPRPVQAPTLHLSVDRPNWQPALGERLVWMVSHGQQRADIVLDPPHLGRVDVQIVMHGDRAQLAFAADTQVSRELLETSLPRLREMLADAGIDLTDVNVGNRQRQAPQQGSTRPEGDAQAAETPDAQPRVVAGSGPAASGHSGLLDLFV